MEMPSIYGWKADIYGGGNLPMVCITSVVLTAVERMGYDSTRTTGSPSQMSYFTAPLHKVKNSQADSFDSTNTELVLSLLWPLTIHRCYGNTEEQACPPSN